MAAKGKGKKKKAKSGGLRKLTAKQAVFVEEYLIDGNGSRSAIAAGYSPKTAKETACENLTKPSIAAALSKAQQVRSKRTEITQDQVLRELAKIAFSNLDDFIDLRLDEEGNEETEPRFTPVIDIAKASRDQRAALTGLEIDTLGDKMTIRTKIKLADKRASLELLGKHLGMFNKLVIAGDDEHPVRVVPDLSKLSDKDLEVMERIQRKLGAGEAD